MSTFLLIHGSWAGGWQWQPVRSLLEAAGHRVLAPSLSGMADRHHIVAEGMGLQTHIDDVVRLLTWERLTDVTLVGHSYGGMVITGAAASAGERVARLVYLDAFLPRAGECAWDILPWQREAFQALRRSDRPWLIDPVDMASVFADELGADFDTSRFTPMPIKTHEERLAAAPPPGTVPVTYIRATRSPHFGSSAARARADAIPVVEIEAGHMLLHTHPEHVATILAAAVERPRP